VPVAKPAASDRDILPFRAPYAPPDEDVAAALLASSARPEAAEAKIDACNTHFGRCCTWCAGRATNSIG
jgi:hypothetical protein